MRLPIPSLLALICVSWTLEATAQDFRGVFRPPLAPDDLYDCNKPPSLCIKFEKIWVHKTPNDPGSWEEWRIRFKVHSQVTSYHFEIPDGLTKATMNTDLYPNKAFCVAPTTPRFALGVYGTEDDQWPNPDDPLPEMWVEVVHACAKVEPPSPGIPVFGDWDLDWLAKSRDGQRYAEYIFHARYK